MTTNPEQHAAVTPSTAERRLDGAGPSVRVGGRLGNAVAASRVAARLFTWAIGLSRMRQKDLAQGLFQLFLQSGLFHVRQSLNGRMQEPTEFAVGEHATIDFGSKQGRIVDREFQYIS